MLIGIRERTRPTLAQSRRPPGFYPGRRDRLDRECLGYGARLDQRVEKTVYGNEKGSPRPARATPFMKFKLIGSHRSRHLRYAARRVRLRRRAGTRAVTVIRSRGSSFTGQLILADVTHTELSLELELRLS